MDEEYGEDVRGLAEAVDDACLPALEEAVAPHLPAIHADLRVLGAADAAAAPSSEEIVERMRVNGLEDPEFAEGNDEVKRTEDRP